MDENIMPYSPRQFRSLPWPEHVTSWKLSNPRHQRLEDLSGSALDMPSPRFKKTVLLQHWSPQSCEALWSHAPESYSMRMVSWRFPLATRAWGWLDQSKPRCIENAKKRVDKRAMQQAIFGLWNGMNQRNGFLSKFFFSARAFCPNSFLWSAFSLFVSWAVAIPTSEIDLSSL